MCCWSVGPQHKRTIAAAEREVEEAGFNPIDSAPAAATAGAQKTTLESLDDYENEQATTKRPCDCRSGGCRARLRAVTDP